MNFKLIIIGLMMLGRLQTAVAQEKSETDMFPQPQEGQKQFIIKVPKQQDESQYKIEVLVGKREKVDKCNQHHLSGKLVSNDLSGWGYTYLNFETEGHILATMMACPDGQRVEKLIFAPGELVRYNSKLPVVVYAPEDYEVSYKIWSTTKKAKSVPASVVPQK
jgi:ecotin